MRLSGYVNTNYLFSITQEEADEEQQKLYRLKHIIHIFSNIEKSYFTVGKKNLSEIILSLESSEMGVTE